MKLILILVYLFFAQIHARRTLHGHGGGGGGHGEGGAGGSGEGAKNEASEDTE